MSIFKRAGVITLQIMLSLLLVVNVQAWQLDDVLFPDTVTLDGTSTELQLNGMGYRTKFVFKIYVGGLYTETRATSRDQVQTLKGPKRVVMHMVYDQVSAQKMADAWREGFEDNTSDEQMQTLSDRLASFIAFFDDLKKGDVVLLDYVPGHGTVVTIRGQQKGVIEGDDFYMALLDVWLGDEPADDDLKQAMLAGGPAD
jgi:hypothetical protein